MYKSFLLNFSFVIVISVLATDEENLTTLSNESSTEASNLDQHNNNDHGHNNLSDPGKCLQTDGSEGNCRSVKACLRQQPNQKTWNSCEWREGHRLPAKVCCLSEQQFSDKLLEEIDNKQEDEATDECDDEDFGCIQSIQRHRCGISKVVSRILPFSQIIRRSKEETDALDIIFPTAYRIVMGNNVRAGQIPWMASVYLRNEFVCGGSIIDHRHIVTAAHCFEISKNPLYFHVKVGSIMIYNGTVYSVDRIFVHDQYSEPRIYHDIAVIRIRGYLKFSDEVSPICLPKLSWITKNKLIGMKAMVSGFGDTSFGGSHSTSLRETDLKILNNSFCEDNYNNLIESRTKFPAGMKRSVICAGHENGGKDACQGDSGGPLTVHINFVGYLIGIVSFGFRCAMERFPGIYTSVAYYLKWLTKVTSLN